MNLHRTDARQFQYATQKNASRLKWNNHYDTSSPNTAVYESALPQALIKTYWIKPLWTVVLLVMQLIRQAHITTMQLEY